MPCQCGGKTIPTKKVSAKKVAPKKVQAKKSGAPKTPAQKRATRIATRKANANNPFAKGCHCT